MNGRLDQALPGAHAPTDEELRAARRVLTVLRRMHAAKSVAYGRGRGASWRRRGELVSMFGNICRKYDRLEEMGWGVLPGAEGTPDETVLDTVGDLATYALLYLTWLATDGLEAADVPDYPDPADQPASLLPTVLADEDEVAQVRAASVQLLRDLHHHEQYRALFAAPSWCLATASGAFQSLERVLLLGRAGRAYATRVRAAEDLAAASVVLLVHLRRVRPEAWREWGVRWPRVDPTDLREAQT